MNYPKYNVPKENLKILFVEDDRIDRIAFQRFVRNEKLKYDVTEVCTVEEAAAALNSGTFDVALCDYNLGSSTSFDLFDKMADIPFILVTGVGDHKTAVSAMKSGASDYILKDNHGNHLQTIPLTIDNAIKRKQAERELELYRENLEDLVKV